MKKSYISPFDIDVVLIKNPTTVTGFMTTHVSAYKRHKKTFEILEKMLKELDK